MSACCPAAVDECSSHFFHVRFSGTDCNTTCAKAYTNSAAAIDGHKYATNRYDDISQHCSSRYLESTHTSLGLELTESDLFTRLSFFRSRVDCGSSLFLPL